jgi:uncharacterized SAM-binding protein YcdF (DUF218 family)
MRIRRALVLLLFGCILLAAWTAGLVIFVNYIPRTPAPDMPPTDAVVVLTGGSERLSEGLRLLQAGAARKLLVSGVHEDVTLAQLVATLPAEAPHPTDAELACCIVLGYEAGNTLGNAQETAAWMAAEGFTSLRLVTANYHMPRSLLEFRQAMPGIRMLANPVFPAQVKREEWWRWPGTAALMVSEYHKFLYALLRSRLAQPPAPL